jgi:hypothetical protein
VTRLIAVGDTVGTFLDVLQQEIGEQSDTLFSWLVVWFLLS